MKSTKNTALFVIIFVAIIICGAASSSNDIIRKEIMINLKSVQRKRQNKINTTSTIEPTSSPSSGPTKTSILPSRPPNFMTSSGLPSSLEIDSSSQPSLITPSSTPSQSNIPSLSPINASTLTPSESPSSGPTASSSSRPSLIPSANPSVSMSPSQSPSANPSESISNSQSQSASRLQSFNPSSIPSIIPSLSSFPSMHPSVSPSLSPTTKPSIQPSTSTQPSLQPTDKPSTQPSSSAQPSTQPTKSQYPSLEHSTSPSNVPSELPSMYPSHLPSFNPTSQNPTRLPSESPSTQPSPKPSSLPSSNPAAFPSSEPSILPTSFPSSGPSVLPTSFPSSIPSVLPTSFPSSKPSTKPTNYPSLNPSTFPSQMPSLILVYSTDIVLGFSSYSSAMDSNVEKTFEMLTKEFLILTMKEVEGASVEIISINVMSQYVKEGAEDGVQAVEDVFQRKRKVQESQGKGLIVDLIVTCEVTTYTNLPENLADTVLNGFYEEFPIYKSLLNDEPVISSSLIETRSKVDPGVAKRGNINTFLLIISLTGTGGVILIAFFVFFLLKGRKKRQSYESDPLPSSLNIERTQEAPFPTDIDQPEMTFTFDNSTVTRDDSTTEKNSSIVDIDDQDTKGSFYPYPSDSGSEGIEGLNDANSHSDTDSDSLGLNLSPDALFEAKRRSQRFSFVPQESNDMIGLYPKSNVSDDESLTPDNQHNYRDNITPTKSWTFEQVCPPGPLGLVIDSTTLGPMVHSVKPYSSLGGTIRAGDFIIGCDDQPTRAMTAPILTRLLASKANNPERKLTLMRYT